MKVSYINNVFEQKTTFQSKSNRIEKFFNIKNIKAQLNQIEASDNDTKKLFASLSALATSAIAGFTVLAEKNEEIKTFAQKAMKELGFNNTNELIQTVNNFSENFELPEEIDYTPLLEENPERTYFLELTSKQFPNLNQKYEDILKKVIKEPDNISNKNTLETMDLIFSILTQDRNNLKYKRGYFEALDKEYNNCLEDICKNFNSTILGGNTPMEYLTMINNCRFTEDEVKKWGDADKIGFEEFLLLRDLTPEQLVKINNVKKDSKPFKVTSLNKMISSFDPERKQYAYMINFGEDNNLKDKLQIIAKFHEAIYGEIPFKEKKEYNESFLTEDIQTELTDNVVKDKRMESVYNFMKYAVPEEVKKFRYTSEEVQLLPKEHPDFIKLKEIGRNYIMNIDFTNKKLQDLCTVLNDKEIFNDIITSRHARLRFITRFVLKNNPKTDLQKDCKQAMENLKNELNNNMNKCIYLSSFHKGKFAPQFYLNHTTLGLSIKITLNSDGSIHTLFEDAKRTEKWHQKSNQKK